MKPDNKTAFQHNIQKFRAFAILNITAIHCWAACYYSAGSQSSAGHNLRSIIESLFHNSTVYFALISGVLYSLVLKRQPITQFYRKKITTIFVPYVFFSGIYTILAGRVFISEDIEPTSIQGMLNAIPSNLLNGSSWGHLWYPPVLLVLFILTPLIYKSLKHPVFQYTLIITAFAPLTISRVWPDFSLNNVCFFGGAYSLGLYIGLYYQKALELFHRFSFALLLSALMLLFPIGYLYQYSPVLNLPFNPIESLSYLQKIFLGCFLIEWLHRTQQPTNKFFNFIATHAYGIYLVHPAISIFAAIGLKIISPSIFEQAGFIALSLYGLVIFSATLLLSITLIMTTKPLLGKYSKLIYGT